MFRYVTAIFLFTAFAAQTFQQAFIVLNYYANTASFAKNCENKNKPMMHCNGKCQMMKKLQEEEKKDRQGPERKLENNTEVVSSKSFFADVSNANFPFQNAAWGIFINAQLLQRSFSFFHPPSIV